MSPISCNALSLRFVSIPKGAIMRIATLAMRRFLERVSIPKGAIMRMQ